MVNDNKIITDQKMEYIIKTLSRTKRKDYENYVINAIWNRLNNNEIEIVSQQYINNQNDVRKHYFIDLYFPSLNIGIECDEAHHLNEKNTYSDKKREANIFDILHGIGNSGYLALHIDVTKNYLEVETEIN
jgi:very-short-patch-repair endonuclease